ncbi:helicase [Providencia stuartii]|uniref:TraI domain-containing protein n=1 Tax=Providencia stuartii TaxID=588 RepID=UPI000537F806|nr:TraI domain-containing protein [Providencia stuartii]AXO18443.1 helicase [Providencia stuartii]
MLPWFRKSLSRKAEEKILPVSPGNTQEKALFIRDSDGFYLPQSADILLATPQRQNWLQQISRVVALPDNQYRALCLSPLQTLAERLQCVPASKTGKYAGEGGLLDLTLNTTAWCMRMSQKEMLPRGLPSEEQSRQFSAWNVCVFYTGLFYWLPLTAQFEGQLNSLSSWQPGISPPSEPYRFRFHEPVPDITHFRRTTGAMMAFRLLPEKVIHWLSGTPKALQALSDVVTGQVNGDNDLQRVLNEALAAFEVDTLPDISGSTIKKVFPGETTAATQLKENIQDISSSGLMSSTSLHDDKVFSSSLSVPAAVDSYASESFNSDTDNQSCVQSAVPVVQPDTLVKPDDDLQYALALSGILSSENNDSADNKDEVNMVENTALSEVANCENKHDPQIQRDIIQNPIESVTEITEKKTVPGNIVNTGKVNKEEVVADNVSPAILAEDFITWLHHSLSEKTLPVNIPGGLVHSIAGYLFLRSPQIFTLYLSRSPYKFERYTPVQRAFESLRLHRRNGKQSGGLVHCWVQSTASSEEKTSWKKTAGYLVKSQKLLPGGDRDDSLYIKFE